MPSLPKSVRWTLLLSTIAVLAACEVGPNYHRPPAETPPAFKEAEGWTPAQPADGVDRGDWWTVFNDPLLNQLEAQVSISNQTLAADLAAYNEAHDVVAQDRAALFPTFNLTGSATESKHGGGSQVTSSGQLVQGSAPVSDYTVELGASWAPDVWGKIRREVEGAKANAQASYADLANARLSAQSTLAADYLELRLLDAQKAVLTKTAEAFQKSLTVTRNQYQAGTVSRGNMLQAETTLYNAQASLTDLDTQRTASEHAIAVLIGKPPADLTIPADPNWAPRIPETPIALPSTLLQRRPDVAAAERSVAAASAQIGVQVAGYYPNITLSGTGGFGSTSINQLFNVSSSLWSVGANVAQTVFNGGLTTALVRQAKSARDQAADQYRQTVLTAFQQVEDDLAASRVLQIEEPQRAAASKAADQEETVAFNEYRAGTVDYTTVVTAQTAALSARQTLLTLQVQRMTTEVSLIEALGGGWSTSQLPKS
ncbi:MAG TPA: efflux transporter outer membrane subunit [Caulobacteraceae bacterium]|jgi:NodT family efflux transporter outer membrane factor (OMF) lipoprotein|nr:efflux transporter outer membrane subunit [Caulobacteraceae bacterium]